MKISLIGTGVMGGPMGRRLIEHGHELTVYTRTREKADAILRCGARWADTVAQCVRGAEVILTIVGYPSDVEAVYFGEGGIVKNAPAGATLIDMTTTSPRLAVRIAEEAAKRGLRALDAPVSGGDVGAQNGTLAIMVGGDEAAFREMMPVFQAMGKNIRHQGAAGFGQHTKMANQIAIAGTLAGVCEALKYGRAAGLDLQTMLDTISTGAAGSWQMSYNAPKIVADDFSPGFFIKHFVKDMTIAENEAVDRGERLVVLEAVLERFRALEAGGLSEEGTQAYIKSYGDW